MTLDVRRSEILGIAGVDGNGQRELAEAIAGQRSVSTGDVRLFGHSIARFKVAQREKLGLRYVTDDRLHEGTVGPMSVAMNIVLKQIGKRPYWERGRIRNAVILEKARELITRFDIQTPGPETRVAALSGGNIRRSCSRGSLVRPQGRHLLQADIRARREDDAQRPPDDSRAGGRGSDVGRRLDGSRRAARSLRPDRGASRGRVAGVVDNGPNAQREIGELMVGGKAAAA